jgi:hypothetical protein
MFIAVNQDMKRKERDQNVDEELSTPVYVADVTMPEPKEEPKAMFNVPSFKIPEFSMPTFSMPKFEPKVKEEPKQSRVYGTINAIREGIKKPEKKIEYESDRVLTLVEAPPEGGDNAKFIKEAKDIVVK